jgi:hypothetical protein
LPKNSWNERIGSQPSTISFPRQNLMLMAECCLLKAKVTQGFFALLSVTASRFFGNPLGKQSEVLKRFLLKAANDSDEPCCNAGVSTGVFRR